jgi:hypothetical protein
MYWTKNEIGRCDFGDRIGRLFVEEAAPFG